MPSFDAAALPFAIRNANPLFGAEIIDFDPRGLDDESVRAALRSVFDQYGLLLFRDLDIDHESQERMVHMLREGPHMAGEDPAATSIGEDTYYISNRRPEAAAPIGKLLFHSDMMWSEKPYEVLSLYGKEIAEPVIPTLFISAARGWKTLPDDLRKRVDGARVRQVSGVIERRGRVQDVLNVQWKVPPSTILPIGWTHPRTGQTILYVCEQHTEKVVDCSHEDSEDLLEALFEHLYKPENQWAHHWRTHDLIVWDNLSIQHARPDVRIEGPVRTLRKASSPKPLLRREDYPGYARA